MSALASFAHGEVRRASERDIVALVSLVNGAYRPLPACQGWTHEADLVAGERLNDAQMRELLNAPNSIVLVLMQAAQIVASVHIEKQDAISVIGLLAVAPHLQQAGIGKHMLSSAEKYAKGVFYASASRLFVLSARGELIQFYVRQGYKQTMQQLPYPVSLGMGTPKKADLMVEVLEKSLLS